MATYRVQMAFPFDSALPRDNVTVNPHFTATDASALVNALKANLISWLPVSSHPFTLKAYDAAAAPPSYPLATASQAGPPAPSAGPRELALCLSYYASYNRPRTRGRLYLPYTWLGGQPGTRPTSTQQDKAIEFASHNLMQNLPSGAKWVVWSQTEHQAQGAVTNIWVDDEWDTVRSRGMAATSRIEVTV